MEIEKVAAETPELIFKEYIDPATGLQPFQARKLGFALGLDGRRLAKAVQFMMALYAAFVATDASLVEINPLSSRRAGDLIALDAKINFDDNALYRHPDIRELRTSTRRTRSRSRPRSTAQLHQAGRQHRLHGQRRRAGDGHDGHHQAGRRRAGQLPRRGRRRQRRSRSRTRSGSSVRPERQGGARQHLRRHHAVRHAGRGPGGGGPASWR